ncbi:MAG: PQQ-binding-like beta-propeller repeat protein [Acidobacteria bacterium]|nr:PQQ-binding-like beta-propeller repeat protein [Acidobacteriota bacterium]
MTIALSLVATAAMIAVTGTRLPAQAPREWKDYAGGPDSSRFVATTQITKANVAELRVAWTYPGGQTGSNPIVARGVVYARARNNAIVALDAATGRELWLRDGLQGMTSRGFNYWEAPDGSDRRLIFAIDEQLQEIDARTGERITTFGTNGKVDLRAGLERDPSTIKVQSGTPGRVFEDLIILGSATNQEYNSAPGDVRAYNVRTGALAWTFHTVPRPGEFGYETWPEYAYKTVGGANNWGEQSIDVARGIVYVPTGSPKHNFYGGHRHGTNLFGDCILALDARTGKRLWHFQTVHHDIWDYDNNSAPQLTTVEQNGRRIDVVAVAGKTGYLYVFDRVTGAPIWPIEERPVPTRTEIPGESVWPTQPFPTSPPPFSKLSLKPDEVNPHILTPDEREQFRRRVAAARYDGPFTPIAYEDTLHVPGNSGGSNWGSTAANPNDGTVYVISLNMPALIRLLKPGEVRQTNGGGAAGTVSTLERPIMDGFGLYPTIVSPPYQTLTAYNLNTGTIKWQIGLGDDLRLVRQGITGTGSASSTKTAVIPTASGLVFATAPDQKVHVYDSDTGRQLHELPLGANTSGSPSMYEHGGKQYLLVTASGGGAAWSGPAGIVAYALP